MTRTDAIIIIKDLDADDANLTQAKEVLYDIGYSMQQVNILRADYGEHTAQNVQKDTTAWVVESMLTDHMEFAILNSEQEVLPVITEAMTHRHATGYAVPSSNVPGDYSIDWTWLENSHGIRFPYMGINNY